MGIAAIVRGRVFALFLAVLLGVYSACALGVVALVPTPLLPLFSALHAIVFVTYGALAWPRMRPLWVRLLVSWPGAFFSAGTLFALPWALLVAFGLHPAGVFVPYLLAAIGLWQSLNARRDDVHLVLTGEERDQTLVRPEPRGAHRDERPLRLVQISDPHLGPFMSVERLAGFCARAVAAEPDLILLTGDFLTMESHSDTTLLTRALAPLQALPGRVFACLGNHDHEAPEHVTRALAANGIRLLVDEACDVETPAGAVQILGFNFVYRKRATHLARVCSAHPRTPNALRLLLLHDPGAFRHLPAGEGDLVLSGHTHGGQVGLVSLGLSWTFLRMFGIRLPDHGYWSRGRDRMYVHRGTGHYGFPLRVGVPAEDGVISVHRVQ